MRLTNSRSSEAFAIFKDGLWSVALGLQNYQAIFRLAKSPVFWSFLICCINPRKYRCSSNAAFDAGLRGAATPFCASIWPLKKAEELGMAWFVICSPKIPIMVFLGKIYTVWCCCSTNILVFCYHLNQLMAGVLGGECKCFVGWVLLVPILWYKARLIFGIPSKIEVNFNVTHVSTRDIWVPKSESWQVD